MAENSKIEWCDHTINLWWGCSKVHTGCKNCYAENTARRWGQNIWGENSPRREVKSSFRDLNKYQKIGAETGRKQVIFCGSMMDIFEQSKSLINTDGTHIYFDAGALGYIKSETMSIRSKLFEMITENKYPDLIFLFLTKRPENISKFIPIEWNENLPENIWFGTSISDQNTADELIPVLLDKTPKGAKLFLSIEPQVGTISLYRDFNQYTYDYLSGEKHFKISNGRTKTIKHGNSLSWIIQGGESGVKKREFKTEWAYLLKSQCKRAKVPYFFKQIDKIRPIPPDLLIREKPFEK